MRTKRTARVDYFTFFRLIIAMIKHQNTDSRATTGMWLYVSGVFGMQPYYQDNREGGPIEARQTAQALLALFLWWFWLVAKIRWGIPPVIRKA